MTISEIHEYLTAHRAEDEVLRLIKEFAPALTAERVMEYLDSDDGFAAVRSRFDRYATKAIATHDEKKETEIQKRIEEAVTEASKKSKLSANELLKAELDELKKQVQDRDNKLERQAMEQRIRDEAQERGVPVELVVDFSNPGLTFERAQERMTAYTKSHAEEVQRTVRERLGMSHQPESGQEPEEDPGSMAGIDMNDFSSANLEKIAEMREKSH